MIAAAASTAPRPSAFADVRPDGFGRELAFESDVPSEEVVGIDDTEDDARVRHRRAGTAASVAGGPGSAPALSGPTWSSPASSTRAMLPPPAPTLRTSTDGKPRHVAEERPADPRLARPEDLPVTDDADVVARTACVGDDRRAARRLGLARRNGRRPAPWPGRSAASGSAPLRRPRRRARRPADVTIKRRPRKPADSSLALEVLEVRRHDGLKRCVDARG